MDDPGTRESESSPGCEKVVLADGLTYFDGERIAKVVAGIGWLLFLGGVALLWVRQVTDAGALAVLAVIVGTVGGGMISAVIFGFIPPSRLDRKERELGYTTFAIRHDPEVALALPRSGIVVRRRGEPEFSRKEYERLARAEIREMRRRSRA